MIIPAWAETAIAGVALAGAFSAGWAVNGWRWEAKQAEALREAHAAFQRQLAKANERAFEYERERQAILGESREQQTAIRTIYRDRVVPAECEPDPAAVGVLQRAVDSANADPAEPGSGVRQAP